MPTAMPGTSNHIDTSTLREEILNHHPRNIKWAREHGIDRSKSSERR